MSEAYGTIYIKAKPELISKFDGVDIVPIELIKEIYDLAEVDFDKADPYGIGVREHWQEGISIHGGYLLITIFGEEWMSTIKPLIAEGKNIEIYGAIAHEYGFTEYYALNSDGTRFYEMFDYESSEDDNEEEDIKNRWKALRPKEYDVEEDNEED